MSYVDKIIELPSSGRGIFRYHAKVVAEKADKEITKLKQSMLLCSGSCHFPDSEQKLNQIKADAIENARLSIIIHSPAREGTFLDGADWAFEKISKQLEDRVSELTNKDKEDRE